MSVAGLLLAAGAGRRFGKPKALVELDGRLFVESAARVLARGGCKPVVVVLGAAAEQVRERADLSGCTVVANPDWETGMGSSLRIGLTELYATDAKAVAVLPVDVPGVTSAAVRRIRAQAGPRALVRAAYGKLLPGHPVLLGRTHWVGVIASATGDVGARDYLRTHPATLIDCADVGSGLDVDTPADLRRRRA